MAADVTSLVHALGGYGEEDPGGGGKPPATLVTRDLLGGGSKAGGQQELDLDLHVPSGFEKRLDMTVSSLSLREFFAFFKVILVLELLLLFVDLAFMDDDNNSIGFFVFGAVQSGKIYIEPRAAAESNPSPPQTNLCDLNLPPRATTTISDDTLDLKLVSSSSSAPVCAAAFQSVCTLEKVKSALERAERESSSSSGKKRLASSAEASPATSAEAEVAAAPVRMYAAACPGCLLYVLVSSENPNCPRCDAVVPSPVSSSSPAKRPKLDLNVAVW